MQLFSRRVSMMGPPAETMAFATDMRSYVADKTGRDVALWSALFGAPVGTMMYTVRVEGIADLQAATAVLMEDEEYHAKIAAGRDLVAAPAEDQIATVLYGELGDPPPAGSMASVTMAVIANGEYERAMGWGVDIAKHVEGVTGLPAMFLANQYGPFGGVTWVLGAPDASTVDKAVEAVNNDADYLKEIGKARDLFIPGSGSQGLLTRVA